MRPELEQHIKQTIETFEFPHDDKAWEQMKATLDQRMPVKRTLTKSWLLGLGLLAIGGVGYLAWNSQHSPETPVNLTQTQASESKNTLISAEQSNQTPNPSTNKTNFSNNKLQVQEHQGITKQSYTSTEQQIEIEPEKTVLKLEQSTEQLHVNPNIENSINRVVLEQEEVRPRVALNPTMCVGEMQILKNDNKQALIISFPTGERKTLEPNASMAIQSNQSGSISIGYLKNGGTEILQTVTAQQNPSVTFENSDVVSYVDGLPVLDFTTEEEENIEWRVNDKVYARNVKEFNLNPFIKGNYTIELRKKHQNGCVSSFVQTISVSESYNLLASNAFNPTSLDFRKSTFMPYALTQRNTPFTLTIIDPTTGVVLFQTTDAATGWDGTDKQTGKPVESNKSFIWKVSLHKPVAGEISEYTGSITKL